MPAQVVIVAERSPRVDLALASLGSLREVVRHFAQPSSAVAWLTGGGSAGVPAPIGAVLIESGVFGAAAAELVSALRRDEATRLIPIVLFGSNHAARRRDGLAGTAANSNVDPASDRDRAAATIAETIRYWALVSQPPIAKG